jgi:hypothetical protein
MFRRYSIVETGDVARALEKAAAAKENPASETRL